MKVCVWILSLCALFILAIVAVCKANEEYENKFPFFLQDFVQHQDIPSQAILFLCYKIDNLIPIMRQVHIPVEFNNFGSFELLTSEKNNTILFVTDLHCSKCRDFMENVIAPHYFAHPFRWIIIQKNENSIPNVKALTDSNIYLATPDQDGDIFKIDQFYKVDENSSIIFEPYGKWSSSHGMIVIQNETILSRRRQNLQNKQIKANIVVTNKNSLNQLGTFKEKHIDTGMKANFILTLHLMDCLNATIQYYPKNTYGFYHNRTGTWNGVMNDMFHKRADIGGGIFFTANRLPYVDYMSPSTPTEIKFIFREPPLSFVNNIYTLPFTGNVWISVGALVVISITVIMATVKLHIEAIEYTNDTSQYLRTLRVSDFVLSGISAICQMGIFIEARGTPARISMLFFLIGLVFLFTSYTANIVSLLHSTTKSIQTLPDLLNSPLELGVHDTSYNRYYFETATNPVQKAIYKGKLVSSKGVKRFMNVTEGIAKVRQGFFAFHVELSIGYQLIEVQFYEREKCNLRTIQYLDVVRPWYAIQKNSPYKEMIKINLFKMREYGLRDSVNYKIYTKKPFCSANEKDFIILGLNDCRAAINILLIGYGLAVFIFILEKTFTTYKLWLM